MKITILGTGCIWTKRACASYLIDDNIMMDIGFGAVKQLFKSNDKLLHHEKIEKIDLVLISHFHNDHYFDIVHIILKEATGKYGENKLTIVCPEGGKEKITLLCQLALGPAGFKKVDIDKYVNFIEAKDGKEFDFGKYHITCYEVDHHDIEAYGYVFKEEGGKTVGFSGDTTMCPALEKIIDESDICFVDMAGTHVSKHHYNIIEGIELIKKYKDQKIIVPCHLTSQALDYCRGKIRIPEELMVMDTREPKPYNFELRKELSTSTSQNFLFKVEELNEIIGRNISLHLLKTEIKDIEKKLPTYYFNITVNKTGEIVGEIKFSVFNKRSKNQNENVDINFKEEIDIGLYAAETFKLIRTIALAHNYDRIYLATTPNEFEKREICESFGATLKTIQTTTEDGVTPDKNSIQEKCIWEWKF